MLTMHMLHSNRFFECNAILEKLAKMQQKMAHNSNTNATAMACNSTLGTLFLKKQEKLRYIGKERNYHPILNQSHNHVGQFLPKKRFFPHDRSRQVNKRCTRKYGPWPSNLVIGTPQEALCGDLLPGDSTC